MLLDRACMEARCVNVSRAFGAELERLVARQSGALLSTFKWSFGFFNEKISNGEESKCLAREGQVER